MSRFQSNGQRELFTVSGLCVINAKFVEKSMLIWIKSRVMGCSSIHKLTYYSGNIFHEMSLCETFPLRHAQGAHKKTQDLKICFQLKGVRNMLILFCIPKKCSPINFWLFFILKFRFWEFLNVTNGTRIHIISSY